MSIRMGFVRPISRILPLVSHSIKLEVATRFAVIHGLADSYTFYGAVYWVICAVGSLNILII